LITKQLRTAPSLTVSQTHDNLWCSQQIVKSLYRFNWSNVTPMHACTPLIGVAEHRGRFSSVNVHHHLHHHLSSSSLLPSSSPLSSPSSEGLISWPCASGLGFSSGDSGGDPLGVSVGLASGDSSGDDGSSQGVETGDSGDGGSSLGLISKIGDNSAVVLFRS